MNPAQSSIALLAVVIAAIAGYFFALRIKEVRRQLKRIRIKDRP